MSGYRLPAPAGAWIDRSRPLRFTLNDRTIDGFAGDTVASALLAQGIVHIGRSIKRHRPRGIVSCGVEEPTGLLDIGLGGERTPNTRATDIAARDGLVATTGNAWPSVGFDLAAMFEGFQALIPAGFYYKTFMWPHWHWFEPAIRRLAGSGVAADAPDPARYDEVSRTVETLVIGAGAAGMQAALAAARSGRQVLLLEGAVRHGGWLASQALRPGGNAAVRLESLERDLIAAGVELRTQCTALGLYDHGFVAAVETVERDGVRERLWKIRARRIVIATGAFERPLLFPDNDRPGVMLASAVERYATHFGVSCGKRIVIATACDSAYGVAQSLRAAGIDVAAIVELRDEAIVRGHTDAPAGVPVLAGSVVGIDGKRAVQRVTIAGRDGTSQTIDADCIAACGGWTPAVNLYSMAGGKLRWVDEASMFVPDRSLPGIATVGACAGAFDLDRALEHASAVGSGSDALAPVGGIGSVPAHTAPRDPGGPVFVDLQNDVTANDIELAARENYRSVEHLKRYTTLGMATDQGKTSNVNALVLMGEQTGRTAAQVGTTKFRPPFKPVTLATIAGGRSGERLHPLRRMPAHDWHHARGGAFEEFGGWLRPAAYLRNSVRNGARNGETLIAAAEREALHVRTHVGLFDASPLGKIEVYGPDAATFLDLMYVGTMSTLAPGQARYGVLLNENGVIVDDGIVARLGDHHFLVNTTAGGAERVALAFEEWLQCEYVNMRVLVTPVTSAWGNVTVAGPKAWALLEAAGIDRSLAPGSMPHMTLRELDYAGASLRVLRASFSGELSYEINVPALRTTALLERLADAGRTFDVQPYGIEALMILRTEKGYLHVGADTDGTTLPGDVGLDRGIAGKVANFAGRRSLSRPNARDPDRMQLVGLVPVDRATRLPVGAHIAPQQPPAPIDGFVTSSAYSPFLRHPIALAMLTRGRQRIGERLTAYHLGKPFAVEVVKTPFVDPEGRRLDG